MSIFISMACRAALLVALLQVLAASAANVCDKCNNPVASGNCKCDNNCNCLTSGPPAAGGTPATGSPSTPAGSFHVAAYWGQGDGTNSEPTLGAACSKYSLVFMSFLSSFGSGQDVSKGIDLSFHDVARTGPDITKCQGLGVKVILSMGGADGKFDFSSSADAKATADQVWNVYLGGTASGRPFGSAVLDGVDLDIESVGRYYADFAARLHSHYAAATRKFYLTAAPQCIFPDADIGPALKAEGSFFDFIGIQFYNNPPCSNGNLVSSYTSDWVPFAKSFSPSPKLIIGLPASSKAAGSGYMAPADAAKAISAAAAHGGGTLWGFFVWSVAYDFDNAVNGAPYSAQVKALLSGSA